MLEFEFTYRVAMCLAQQHSAPLVAALNVAEFMRKEVVATVDRI